METVDLTKNLILVPTFMLLILALVISFSTTVGRMVSVYILQSCMLALITVLTGLEIFIHGRLGSAVPYIFLGLLPLSLALIIRPLLARATLLEHDSWYRDILNLQRRQNLIAKAEPIWLEHGRSRINVVLNIFINLTLAILSFFIAYKLTPGAINQSSGQSPIDSINFAISLGLLLSGLFVLIVKMDIISQIMGLLIMEHGLFLAAIKVVTIPTLALIFVISMFAYILITLLILVILLPALREEAQKIEVSEMSELKG
jgi:hydrogenase-4 membrane subunit HyfE